MDLLTRLLARTDPLEEALASLDGGAEDRRSIVDALCGVVDRAFGDHQAPPPLLADVANQDLSGLFIAALMQRFPSIEPAPDPDEVRLYSLELGLELVPEPPWDDFASALRTESALVVVRGLLRALKRPATLDAGTRQWELEQLEALAKAGLPEFDRTFIEGLARGHRAALSGAV